MGDLKYPGTDAKDKDIFTTVVEQKSRKYVLANGEDLFQSLYPADKTSPASPGSEASSSTLLDPSSRKVSPSDLENRAKGSPTAVKDFAYSPSASESNDVLDPVTLIDQKTKKELLKLLKKKTIAEEEASQEVARLSAQIETLSAKLESAKADARTRDAQIELATTHASALTLSNVVLQHEIQDLSHELNRMKNGAPIQSTQQQGEVRDQQEENSLEPETKVEDSEDRTEEKANGFDEKYGVDPAVLSNILDPVTPAVPDTEEESQEVPEPNKYEVSSSVDESGLATSNDSQQPAPEADKGSWADDETSSQHAEEEKKDDQEEDDLEEDDQPEDEQTGSGTFPTGEKSDPVEENVEWIFPGLKPKDTAGSNGLAMADPIATNPEDAMPDQDDMSHSSGEDQVFDEDGDNSSSTAEDCITGTDRDEAPAVLDPITDGVLNKEYSQGTSVGHEGCINENYEFSEAAGPATLWGILQSNHHEKEAEKETDSGREFASISEAEAPGPATLWGILKSDRECSDVEFNNDGSGEITGENGTLALDESKSNGFGDSQDQDDAKLNVPSVDDASPEPNDDFNGLHGVSDIEEEVHESLTTMGAPVVEKHPALNPHGSFDNGYDTVLTIDASEVAVQEDAHDHGVDAPHDSVKVVVELVGDLQLDEDNHEVANGLPEAANLEEKVLTIAEHTPIGTVEKFDESADDATVVRVEKDTPGANETKDAVVRPSSFQEAVSEKKEDSQKDDKSRTMQPTCEDANGSLTTSKPPSPPDASASPPETFDLMHEVPKPKEMTKGQKRKLERKRAAARKVEDDRLRRFMEAEAAKTPEALAQRQAEEDSKMGEKRVKLQNARAQRELELASVPSAKWAKGLRSAEK